jgi:hypothetical protein
LASWRRKALALFPDLGHDVQQRDYSIYMLFFDILPMSREAHKAGDDEMLRRVYGFAEWCFAQKAKDLSNSAGVAFYEHLFDDHPSLWPEVVQWLSPQVIHNCWGLWESRLPSTELAKLKRLIEDRRQRRDLEACLASGLSGPVPRTAEPFR